MRPTRTSSAGWSKARKPRSTPMPRRVRPSSSRCCRRSFLPNRRCSTRNTRRRISCLPGSTGRIRRAGRSSFWKARRGCKCSGLRYPSRRRPEQDTEGPPPRIKRRKGKRRNHESSHRAVCHRVNVRRERVRVSLPAGHEEDRRRAGQESEPHPSAARAGEEGSRRRRSAAQGRQASGIARHAGQGRKDPRHPVSSIVSVPSAGAGKPRRRFFGSDSTFHATVGIARADSEKSSLTLLSPLLWAPAFLFASRWRKVESDHNSVRLRCEQIQLVSGELRFFGHLSFGKRLLQRKFLEYGHGQDL